MTLNSDNGAKRMDSGDTACPSLYKILFVSLGCDKNLVDSEQMIALLEDSGFEFTDDENDADVAVINSCCFIGDAKQESIDTIIRMGTYRNGGHMKGLIVTGCLAQRYASEIRKELPEVDAIVGTTAFEEIVSVVRGVLAGKGFDVIESADRFAYSDGHREVTTGGHFAYLKIAEGCDKHCTYCVIPKVRGKYRSVPMESLLKDARALAAGGVKELILVAQETTVYGTDLYGHKALPELLRKLCMIGGFEWIRILYCYPEEIDDELISVIVNEPKICHYLDLPIQHCNDRILKAMGRRTTKSDLVDIIRKLRSAVPDISLRTTLISGFPGETDEEHEELVQFVRDMKFDRLGDFTYSREENTPAAKYPGQVKAAVKKRRHDEIMRTQQGIAFANAAAMKGKKLDVIIEGRIPEDDVYVGRTYRDAPNIDGFVFVNGAEREYMTGDFVKVIITGSNEYDLIGSMEEKNESAE